MGTLHPSKGQHNENSSQIGPGLGRGEYQRGRKSEQNKYTEKLDNNPLEEAVLFNRLFDLTC